MTASLESWARAVEDRVGLLSRGPGAIEELRTIPRQGCPGHRLEVLLKLRSWLGLPPPGTGNCSAWEERVRALAGDSPGMTQALRGLFAEVDLEVGRSVEAGGRHPEVIAGKDFGPAGIRVLYDFDMNALSWILGEVSYLPVGHALHRIPEGERYEARAVLLGVTRARPQLGEEVLPAAWYLVTPTLARTRQAELERRRRQEEYQARERRRQEESEAAWRASKDGQLAELRARVARLEGQQVGP
jgi:hypothetical protein